MGGDLAGYLQALGFRERDHGDRTLGGEVGDVESGTGQFGQEKVAGDHDVLRCGRDAAQAEPDGLGSFVHVAAGAEVEIFAVLHDGQIVAARELHGAAHHARSHHG